MGIKLGRDNVCYIHLTLVPYIPTAGEMKTKPTQHSVKELREIGIQPDIVLCRADRPLPDGERRKIALFTNVPAEAVISGARRRLASTRSRRCCTPRASTTIVCQKLGIDAAAGRPLDVEQARRRARASASTTVHIAMVGKYVDLTESYKSLSEALIHAGIHTRSKVQIHYVDSEAIERDGIDALQGMDAILVPGGFGKRGVEGKIAAIRYARENGIPYLGICLGMQLAVIEYARHMAGLADANSTEFDPDTPHPVVALITEWQNRDGSIERRTDEVRPRRHDAPGRAAVRGRAGLARASRSTARRRSPSATAIATRSTTITCRGSRRRACAVERAGEERDGRRPVRDDRAADHPWFFGCQFHPSSRRTRAAAIRCS